MQCGQQREDLIIQGADAIDKFGATRMKEYHFFQKNFFQKNFFSEETKSGPPLKP